MIARIRTLLLAAALTAGVTLLGAAPANAHEADSKPISISIGVNTSPHLLHPSLHALVSIK